MEVVGAIIVARSAAIPVQAAYTHRRRSKNPPTFVPASTAAPPGYSPRSPPPRLIADNELSLDDEKGMVPEVIDATSVYSRSSSGASDSDLHATATAAPLAIFPQHIASAPTKLIMKENALTFASENFSVQDPSGKDLFAVRAETFSRSQRKMVYDAAGTHLFTIRKDLYSVPRTYYAEDPSGNKIFEVEGKWYFGESKAEAHFVNATTMEKETLWMQGSWLNRHAVITEKGTGRECARIQRDVWNPRQLARGRQTYAVEVMAGVDVALMVGMCVCLDERRDD